MSGPRVRMSLGFGFALLALGALSTACTSERESSPVSKPRATETLASTQPMNLVMIGLDTLRADHVGLYGYERPTTPNLDRFAEASVVFERAYSQASSTRPSHQSMFQSRPPSAAAANYLALAEVLLENGFRTAAFTGGGNISSRLGFARGFERYEERDTGLAGTLPMAAAWLREHRDERFFLFLHTYDIHLPYDPPEPYASMFSENYEGVVTGPKTRSLLRRVRELDGFEGKSFDLETNDRERVVALYDGGIRYADNQLAHLFRLAEELDLYRDTVFVFFSDHGEEFWDHGTTIHSHSLYQEQLHVPLILRTPKRDSKRIADRVPLMDLSPTLLELLALPVPSAFEGESLVGLIDGSDTGDRIAIAEQRALKSWFEYPWKFIRSTDTGRVELYDLEKDPLEQNNVADTHPDIAIKLSDRLNARLAEGSGDAVPELEPGIVDPEHLERLRALGYIE